MKSIPSLAALAFATALLLAPVSGIADPPVPESVDTSRKRSQWEHCAFTHNLGGDQSNAEIARTINGLGNDGWELVSVANFEVNGTTSKTVYYFKRPL